LGSEKGYRFFGERKSLKRALEAVEVFKVSAGAKGTFERAYRSSERKKALKGKAQECWGLKEASEDAGANTAERVAKPWGWDF
jgi:hypothetical protein